MLIFICNCWSTPILFRDAGICQAASRVFIFDYGGTLLHKEKFDIYIKRKCLSAVSGRKPSRKFMFFFFFVFFGY
jgi:hypothetical protein